MKARIIQRLHDEMKLAEGGMDKNPFNPSLYIAIIHSLRDLRNI